ncbi:MAG: hypothetical protein A3B68_04810 [Candidatus Melainabacteria bacterium RIFCSPHIGHO2_02_FULL_34_12]|nr:MAG: hypothetical protein A3B68_04810 [Candidatus Melainabacteria bacterium RIFCSPHIGHO2_02_FULL_34_12]
MKINQFLLSILPVSLLFLFAVTESKAFVNCQPKYDNDKRSLSSLKGKCSVCHVDASGNGPQNEFGRGFKAAGFMITDDLVAKFPQLFKQPDETPSTSSGSVNQDIDIGSPSIKRVKPSKVRINLQSMATVIGNNFAEGSKAFIDNIEVLTTFKSKFKLIIEFILNSTGQHELKVKNSDGKESNSVNIKGK